MKTNHTKDEYPRPPHAHEIPPEGCGMVGVVINTKNDHSDVEGIVEEIDIAIANLLFAGLSIEQMEKIPKWLLENIEKNKSTFRTTLTQYHQDLMSEVVEKLEGLKRNQDAPKPGDLHFTGCGGCGEAYPAICGCREVNQALTEAQNIIKSK